MVSDQCKSRLQAEPHWEIRGQNTLGGFCRGNLSDYWHKSLQEKLGNNRRREKTRVCILIHYSQELSARRILLRHLTVSA